MHDECSVISWSLLRLLSQIWNRKCTDARHQASIILQLQAVQICSSSSYTSLWTIWSVFWKAHSQFGLVYCSYTINSIVNKRLYLTCGYVGKGISEHWWWFTIVEVKMLDYVCATVKTHCKLYDMKVPITHFHFLTNCPKSFPFPALPEGSN